MACEMMHKRISWSGSAAGNACILDHWMEESLPRNPIPDNL